MLLNAPFSLNMTASWAPIKLLAATIEGKFWDSLVLETYTFPLLSRIISPLN